MGRVVRCEFEFEYKFQQFVVMYTRRAPCKVEFQFDLGFVVICGTVGGPVRVGG